ncbi:unnamed protein product [Effrenium voratum]|uniref:Phosphomannomutase n=1 Tax=Effrenium voratum TaxID=2562239 RepID=A0AA36IHQ6_9DINO|nr:unnamed protein product [Effrenium voratum]
MEPGFGAGNPVKGKKKKYVDHSVEELDVVFGIGNGPQGCSVREGIVLAGDVEEFQVLRLTEWPTVSPAKTIDGERWRRAPKSIVPGSGARLKQAMACVLGIASGILALFDVDGTLTEPRKLVSPETLTYLQELRTKICIGVVGGSDLVKQKEQLGDSPALFDYAFSENGLLAFKDGQKIGETSIKDHLGEEKLKKLINWVLRYFADLDIPVKRGTFVEFRQGMMNLSPIGRNCSREERNEFEKFDLANGIRKTMVKKMTEEFADLGLTYSIGGQISFDVFPTGWDKTYCLRYLPEAEFDEIHFFGDKTRGCQVRDRFPGTKRRASIRWRGSFFRLKWWARGSFCFRLKWWHCFRFRLNFQPKGGRPPCKEKPPGGLIGELT